MDKTNEKMSKVRVIST